MVTRAKAAPEDERPPQGYALLEHAHAVVLPMDIAMQVFALLCQGEKVSYDWQAKTYRIVNEGMPTLRMFSITEYATLKLEEPMKDT